MSARRLILNSAALLAVASSSLLAQSDTAKKTTAPGKGLKGTWVGVATANGDPRNVTFVFDSTATGWVGATTLPEMGTTDSLYFDRIAIKGDTVNLSLPIQPQMGVTFRGVLTGNKFNADLWINGQVAGNLRMARAGSAEAAAIFGPPALTTSTR